MHDVVIRGGTIVDGTGVDRFVGDIGIDDGRIAEVGGRLEGTRVVENQRIAPTTGLFPGAEQGLASL